MNQLKGWFSGLFSIGINIAKGRVAPHEIVSLSDEKFSDVLRFVEVAIDASITLPFIQIPKIFFDGILSHLLFFNIKARVNLDAFIKNFFLA